MTSPVNSVPGELCVPKDSYIPEWWGGSVKLQTQSRITHWDEQTASVSQYRAVDQSKECTCVWSVLVQLPFESMTDGWRINWERWVFLRFFLGSPGSPVRQCVWPCCHSCFLFGSALHCWQPGGCRGDWGASKANGEIWPFHSQLYRREDKVEKMWLIRSQLQ